MLNLDRHEEAGFDESCGYEEEVDGSEVVFAGFIEGYDRFGCEFFSEVEFVKERYGEDEHEELDGGGYDR